MFRRSFILLAIGSALVVCGCGSAIRNMPFPELVEGHPPETATLLVAEVRIEVESAYNAYFIPRGFVFRDKAGKDWEINHTINLDPKDPETWWASAELPPNHYALTHALGRDGSVSCRFPVPGQDWFWLNAGAPTYIGRIVLNAEVCECEPPCWIKGLPAPTVQFEKQRESELAVWTGLLEKFPDGTWTDAIRARVAEVEAQSSDPES